MKLNVVYFAWVRERIGLPSEDIDTSANTVAELIDELRAREPRYQAAFAEITVIRAAIDQELISYMDTSLGNAREVAFFPPMTGG
jgi:molybdopterin synthase sulfur carrier subunit